MVLMLKWQLKKGGKVSHTLVTNQNKNVEKCR